MLFFLKAVVSLLPRSAAAPSAAWDKTLAQALSKRIASAARANSKDNAFRSPWAVELAQQRGEVRPAESHTLTPLGPGL